MIACASVGDPACAPIQARALLLELQAHRGSPSVGSPRGASQCATRRSLSYSARTSR